MKNEGNYLYNIRSSLKETNVYINIVSWVEFHRKISSWKGDARQGEDKDPACMAEPAAGMWHVLWLLVCVVLIQPYSINLTLLTAITTRNIQSLWYRNNFTYHPKIQQRKK